MVQGRPISRGFVFNRLATLEVLLPKLSERKEDLLLLVRHFVSVFAKKFNKSVAGRSRAGPRLASWLIPGREMSASWKMC